MSQKKHFDGWVKKETIEWSLMGHEVVRQIGGIISMEDREAKSYWNSNCFEALHSSFADCSYFYTYIFEEDEEFTYYIDFQMGTIELRYGFTILGNEIVVQFAFKKKNELTYQRFSTYETDKEIKKAMLNIEEKYTILNLYMISLPNIRLRLAVGALRYRDGSFNHEKVFKQSLS